MSHFVELEVFEIEDKKYTYSRLGILTTQKIQELLTNAWKNGHIDLKVCLSEIETLSPQQLSEIEVTEDMALFFMSKHLMEEFLELQASHLLRINEDGSKEKVKYEEILDPELFPMYSQIILGVMFLRHPDLGLFVDAFKEGKNLPLVQDLLKVVKSKMTEIQKMNPSASNSLT